MNAEPVVRRVLRRFLSRTCGVTIEPEVYTITSTQIASYLFPDYGTLANLSFLPSSDIPANTVSWAATDERGQIVRGHLVLRGGVGAGNGIVLWPEIVVDSIP